MCISPNLQRFPIQVFFSLCLTESWVRLTDEMRRDGVCRSVCSSTSCLHSMLNKEYSLLFWNVIFNKALRTWFLVVVSQFLFFVLFLRCFSRGQFQCYTVDVTFTLMVRHVGKIGFTRWTRTPPQVVIPSVRFSVSDSGGFLWVRKHGLIDWVQRLYRRWWYTCTQHQTLSWMSFNSRRSNQVPWGTSDCHGHRLNKTGHLKIRRHWIIVCGINDIVSFLLQPEKWNAVKRRRWWENLWKLSLHLDVDFNKNVFYWSKAWKYNYYC